MSNNEQLTLTVLPGTYGVCKIPREDAVKNPAPGNDDFYSVTYTDEEISIICKEELTAGYSTVELGWKIVKIVGQLDFSLTGIFVSVTKPLADRGISIFALSTYNTDYILIKNDSLPKALEIWEKLFTIV